MSNIFKDEQEEAQKFETLYKFVRPEAFWNKDNIVETTGFIEGIEEKLGRKLTDEELQLIKGEPDSDLDTIERAGE